MSLSNSRVLRGKIPAIAATAIWQEFAVQERQPPRNSGPGTPQVETAEAETVSLSPPPQPDPQEEARAILAQAEQQAQQVLAAAQAEAQAIVAQAEREAAQLLKETRAQAEKEAKELHERTMQEAYEQAHALAREELGEYVSVLQRLAAAAHLDQEQFYQESEAELVRLAFRIAEAIVRRQIALDRSVLTNAVREGLERIHQNGTVRIRVNPSEASHLQRAWTELGAEAATRVSCEIVADPAISPGGCIIESKAGLVDATIETQMKTIQAAIEMTLRP